MSRLSHVLCNSVIIGLMLLFAATSFAGNDDRGRRGKKYKNYKYRSHHGGFSHVEITPGGISYGYDSGSFGIHLGPFLGGGNHYPVYDQGPFFGGRVVEPVMDSTGYYPPIAESPGSYQGPVAPPAQPEYNDGPPIAPTPDGEPSFDPNLNIRNATLIPTNREAELYQRDAEAAFLDARYELAEKFVRHSILEDPANGKLYLFAAQAQFAVGKYSAACRSIEMAMDLLNQSEWGIVVRDFQQFYSGDNYVKQMDALNRYLKHNPTASYAATLRGYHFQFLGYEDAARKDYNRSLNLHADDPMTKKLRSILSETLSPKPVPADQESSGSKL